MTESRELDGIHFLFPVGEKTPEKGQKSFTGGDVYHFMFIPHESKLNCPLGNVTYTPGSRNSWHAHPGLQVLLVTYGRGWYQEEGRAPRELHAGDYVVVEPGVKHWHGAAKDSYMAQLGFVANCPEDSTLTFEHVSDEEYAKLP